MRNFSHQLFVRAGNWVGFWCSSNCCIGSVLEAGIRRVNLCLWKRNLMEMKPAHFILIRFHHVVPSKCLQHPGNKGRDLRNIQKLKGHGSYGLSACLLFKKKISSLLFFQQLKTMLKKSIQGDNKNSQAKCSPAVTQSCLCAAEGTDSFALTNGLQAGDRLHFSLI